MNKMIDPADYQKIKELRDAGRMTDLVDNPKRFVPFFERENRSELLLETVKAISHGKYMTQWKGVHMHNDPFDTVIYQQLLWDLKPMTIFEIGSMAGGTSLWLADLLDMYQIDGHIYSVDIDLSLVHDKAKNHSRITFIEGDCHQLEICFPPELMQTLPHPWLVLEDAHVNVFGVLEYFHKNGMQSGDYIVIEDTNPDTASISGMGFFKELGYERWGTKKLELLTKFMATHEDEYRVDSLYTDMFGYNVTWHWNSYLRRA